MTIWKKALFGAAVSTMVAMPLLTFASTSSKLVSDTNSATTVTKLACVATAVDARETALIGAADAFAGAWKTALTTRQTDLKAAWAMTNTKERRTAINSAWNAYNKAMKAAKQSYRTARNKAWTDFRTASKACKVTVTNDDAHTSASDMITTN